MSSVGGSSSSGRSSSTSSTTSANRSSTTSPAATTSKATLAKGVGHSTKDTFADGKLPQCEVITVKGNTGRSGTGVVNDVCTFNPPTGPIQA